MEQFKRVVLLVIIDIVLVNLGLYFALWLRFDGSIPGYYLASYRELMPVFALVLVAVFFLFGLYNRLWQYASTGDLLAIAGAVTVGMIMVTGYALIRSQGVLYMLPRSVFIISWVLVVILVGGSRLSWRILRDHWFFPGFEYDRKPVLIVGAGDAGAAVARELKNHNGKSVPLGFIDDDQKKQKLKMFGVPVMGGRYDIPRLVKQYGIREIILAIPSAPAAIIREIVDICSTTDAKLKIVPSLYQFIDGKVSVDQIRALKVEDLLDREPVEMDLESVSGYLTGRTVLVTGAGVTIGSELCRQVVSFAPEKLILLDHEETGTYEIHREICERNTGLELVPVVADVKDEASVTGLFEKYRPEVVFHAAAYKHVPLLEDNAVGALKNNVLGTANLVRAARRVNTETFVFVSTDKAVNPSSIMGATKRVAEMIVQEAAGSGNTRFSAVRFGNVLGSRGSVVPLFQEQIRKGGPVTVTHPEMTRYFMTIPEAVQLVIQAGALARGGEVFILNMGKPIKILDLARRMIKLAGFRPGEDIDIVFSGIRPGEKLHEELLTPEEGISSTRHQRIFVARPNFIDSTLLKELIDSISRAGWMADKSEVIAILRTVFPSFRLEGGDHEFAKLDISSPGEEALLRPGATFVSQGFIKPE